MMVGGRIPWGYTCHPNLQSWSLGIVVGAMSRLKVSVDGFVQRGACRSYRSVLELEGSTSWLRWGDALGGSGFKRHIMVLSSLFRCKEEVGV